MSEEGSGSGQPRRVVVVGGGAAGFFGAVTCAEAASGTEVILLERGPEFLAKVRISGGGRCNVTHACFDPRELVGFYPRGSRELLGPFHRFQPADTVRWFEERGVTLKTEADGRMFPVTDRSQTIIDCLLQAARGAGVDLRTNAGVERVARRPGGGFLLTLSGNRPLACDRLLLASGGCRAAAGGALAVSLGHTLEPPVPSLFTFQIETPWLRQLAGVSVPEAEVAIADAAWRARGPLLVTHWGLSGPAVLKLSAWAARELAARDYRFTVRVDWFPGWSGEAVAAAVAAQRREAGARTLSRAALGGLPGRLWERLVAAAGISPQLRWAELSRGMEQALTRTLRASEFPVTGKSLNKDEFVTCGGVRLSEVDFKTMESRVCPGLHLAGELLDIDGLTGGFNFQAAWTTGWLAGNALAAG